MTAAAEHVDLHTGEVTSNLGPLAAKIALIAASVTGRVAKDGRNEFHKYNYASESNILEAIRAKQADVKIAIVPSVLPESISVQPIGDKGEMLTTLVVGFTIIDGDSGGQIYATYPGAGTDKTDKGVYKAVTGATKYFLQKLYQLPTGDDPEKEGTGAPASSARSLGAAVRSQTPAGAPQGPRPVTTSGPRPLGVPAATVTVPAKTEPPTAAELFGNRKPIEGTLPPAGDAVDLQDVFIRQRGVYPASHARAGQKFALWTVLTGAGQKLAAFDAIGDILDAAFKAKQRVVLQVEQTNVGPKIIGARVIG